MGITDLDLDSSSAPFSLLFFFLIFRERKRPSELDHSSAGLLPQMPTKARAEPG